MTIDPLAWRVEQACAVAYPPAERFRIGDWHVALSGGGSRRINAASPVTAGADLDSLSLAGIDALYGAAGLSTIVRVTDLAPAATELLDKAGFAAPEGATRTLLCKPGGVGNATGTTVIDHADPRWLAARRRFAPGASDPAGLANRIAAPTGYALRKEDGAVVSIGYAVLHDRIAVIEAIGTDPTARRRGHARAIVAALIAWATGRDAEHIALQVEETNGPARALYAGMGFATDLYGYHYRRRASCQSRG